MRARKDHSPPGGGEFLPWVALALSGLVYSRGLRSRVYSFSRRRESNTPRTGTRTHATGTRLPGVHNYRRLTHKNARFLPTDLDSLDRPSPPPLPHPSLTLPFSSTSPVGPHRRIPYQTRFSLEGSGSGTGPPLWQTIAEGPSSDPIPLFVTPHTFLLSYPSWSPSGRASPLDRATPFRSLNTPASSPR